MEPGSCIPLQTDVNFLLILLIVLFSDCLISVILTVYRTLLEEDILIPSSEGHDPDRPLYLQLIDDFELIGKLLTASRFFTIMTAAVCMLTAVFVWHLPMKLWTILLAMLGIAAAIILIESSGLLFIGGNLQKTAQQLEKPCNIFATVFTPLYHLTVRPKPELGAELPDDIEDEENHLRNWVENIPDNTLLEQGERQMIRSIVHFSNTMIREIMIPRIEVDALELNTPCEEAARKVLDSGHSRLPVYDDEIDNIIGVLYAKDLLQALLENRTASLKELLREPMFVPETKMAGDLLSEMRSAGIHMAVVVDEYGGTSGVVSMEDIVEEIVGEIRDEYDEGEEQLVRRIGEDSYSFLGRIDLEDVNEYLEIHLPRGTADTLAGFLYAKIGRFPTVNESITEEGWNFRIEELSGRRIRRVFVSRISQQESEDEEHESD